MSWFKNWFKKVVKPIFRATTTQVINTGLGFAIQAVLDVANDKTLVTDSGKRAAWAKSYLDQATAAGITIATGSALNLLRETALETAKADGTIK